MVSSSSTSFSFLSSSFLSFPYSFLISILFSSLLNPSQSCIFPTPPIHPQFPKTNPMLPLQTKHHPQRPSLILLPHLPLFPSHYSASIHCIIPSTLTLYTLPHWTPLHLIAIRSHLIKTIQPHIFLTLVYAVLLAPIHNPIFLQTHNLFSQIHYIFLAAYHPLPFQIFPHSLNPLDNIPLVYTYRRKLTPFQYLSDIPRVILPLQIHHLHLLLVLPPLTDLHLLHKRSTQLLHLYKIPCIILHITHTRSSSIQPGVFPLLRHRNSPPHIAIGNHLLT